MFVSGVNPFLNAELNAFSPRESTRKRHLAEIEESTNTEESSNPSHTDASSASDMSHTSDEENPKKLYKLSSKTSGIEDVVSALAAHTVSPSRPSLKRSSSFETTATQRSTSQRIEPKTVPFGTEAQTARFRYNLTREIQTHLRETGNQIISGRQARKFSDFKAKKDVLRCEVVAKEKRRVIPKPDDLMNVFFAQEHLSLPGMQPLKRLMDSISTFNKEAAGYSHVSTKLPEMIKNHAELRLLLFYFQCIAYQNISQPDSKIPDYMRWEGAKFQLFEGFHAEAAHHTLLAHINENFILKLKETFTRQFEDAVKGRYGLNPKLVILLLSIGVDAAVLEKQYDAVLTNKKSLHEAVEIIFQDCQKSNLIDEQTLFYFINNHTLVAPGQVNRLDDLIEDELRSTAQKLLLAVSKGQLTPLKASEELNQSLGEAFKKIEADLKKLAPLLSGLGKSVRAYMETDLLKNVTMDEKTSIVKNFLQHMSAIEQKMQALTSSSSGIDRRVYNKIYKINDPLAPIVSTSSIRAVQKFKTECQDFLNEKNRIKDLLKQSEENVKEIEKIRHYSLKRNQGIEDIKTRQADLQRFIKQGDPKAIEKYKEYTQRIKKIVTEENEAQAKLQNLMDFNHSVSDQINAITYALVFDKNSQFEKIMRTMKEITPLLGPYNEFANVSDIESILLFMNYQKVGSDNFEHTVKSLPAGDHPGYEALQSLLLSHHFKMAM